MLIIFTGDGKGKTTAALGQALRALGNGKKVLMIEFIKMYASGEDKAVKSLAPNFEIRKMGRGFVGMADDTIPLEEHKEAAEKALNYFVKEFPRWDVIILDELNVAIHLGLIDEDKVLAILKKIPEEKDIIITGRNASKKLMGIADLVTEMKNVKHPFDKGKKARMGVEY